MADKYMAGCLGLQGESRDRSDAETPCLLPGLALKKHARSLDFAVIK